MKVFFDVLHLYYLPQYIPVHKELSLRGIETHFVFYHGIFDDVIKQIIAKEQLSVHWLDSDKQARDYYLQHKPNWIFFANAFKYLDDVHQVSKSAQLGHGIGPKASYYTKSDTAMTVRFVEGEYRCSRLREMYPNDEFVDVGFCKLDPIINGQQPGFDMQALGLDNNKPTLTYAPTFYPSSIEKFAKNWPDDFKQYNILLKPHYFSIAKEKYRKQKRLLEHWATFDNVYLAKVEDYSLVPFLASSDILISDASSALFEFAALNKPVVWCDFLKLRKSYSGPLKFRFNKRMDQDYGEYANIAVHAKDYKHLQQLVEQQYQHPEQLQEVRLSMSEKLAGTLDGKASQRIVDYLCQD
ncbi:CDP-glycerol--poly(glycerophosphate) glycerophosphotransferase [Thalassotalea sp. HSM 43]|uniref:CDP-glycerol glycerophosphotransferase family protein n=1 Tax=Thalassotalea sp. HSM 43 TaxID=2552945 RepID=UPI001081C091|nr:CDP-glycerol glycerophosphotransferase family protein [Thalassotalea sp. HSM 43]QBY03704.1 CDP-glycerol--poly(glycerophosphate) glycerophosphotransferase [Thalassotalea sp. HSM 43]